MNLLILTLRINLILLIKFAKCCKSKVSLNEAKIDPKNSPRLEKIIRAKCKAFQIIYKSIQAYGIGL